VTKLDLSLVDAECLLGAKMASVVEDPVIFMVGDCREDTERSTRYEYG
jgi:hypothetical protein